MAERVARARAWLERRESLLAWTAVTIAFAVFLVDTARTIPLLHIENWRHLPFYGRSRGLGIWAELTKIFDVCTLDDCFWRNRPVNFLIELFDTKMMMVLNGAGIPWAFRSVSRLVLVPATAAFVAAGLRGVAPALPRASAWVWGAAFAVSGQVLATAAILGRPAKLWAAFGTAVIFWLWARTGRQALFSRAAAGAAAALCVVVLGDEQPVYMLCVFLAIDAWRLGTDAWSGVKPERLGGAFLGAGAVGLAFWAFNFRWAGPRLVAAFSTGALQRDWSDPRGFLRPDDALLREVLSSLSYQASAVFGDWWDGGWAARGLAAAGFVLAAWALRGPSAVVWPLPRRRLGTVLGVAVLLMVYVMGSRHRAVLSEDIRRLSYYQATAVAALVGVALWFERRGGLATASRRNLVSAALIAFSAASFLATPRTKAVALSQALESSKPWNAVIWQLVESPQGQGSIPPGVRPDVLDFARFSQGFIPAGRFPGR